MEKGIWVVIGIVVLAVAGLALWSAGSFQKQQTGVISPTPSTPQEVDETANWPGYQGYDLGFEINAPSPWYLTNNSELAGQSGEPVDQYYLLNESNVGAPTDMSENGVWITIRRLSKNSKSLAARAEELVAEHAFEVTSKEEIQVGTYQALKQFEKPGPDFEGGGGPRVTYYIEAGDSVYTFETIYFKTETFTANEQTIDRIIGTFKLI